MANRGEVGLNVVKTDFLRRRLAHVRNNEIKEGWENMIKQWMKIKLWGLEGYKKCDGKYSQKLLKQELQNIVFKKYNYVL